MSSEDHENGSTLRLVSIWLAVDEQVRKEEKMLEWSADRFRAIETEQPQSADDTDSFPLLVRLQRAVQTYDYQLVNLKKLLFLIVGRFQSFLSIVKKFSPSPLLSQYAHQEGDGNAVNAPAASSTTGDVKDDALAHGAIKRNEADCSECKRLREEIRRLQTEMEGSALLKQDKTLQCAVLAAGLAEREAEVEKLRIEMASLVDSNKLLLENEKESQTRQERLREEAATLLQSLRAREHEVLNLRQGSPPRADVSAGFVSQFLALLSQHDKDQDSTKLYDGLQSLRASLKVDE